MGNADGLSRKARTLFGLTALVSVVSFVEPGATDETCPRPADLVISDFSRGFVQTRHLKGLDAPIISKGVVSLRGDIVDWHTRVPFDIRTTIDPNGITQSIDGEEPHAVDVGTIGGMASVLAALTALLRVDFDSLKQTFRIENTSQGRTDRWSATLMPLDEAVATMLGSMDVSGCESVEHVTLRRPSGDYDQIDIVPAASSNTGENATVNGAR